ncbi:MULTISPECIES: hypothetical protein [Moorena]|uniref:Calcineurin-like phosphoesterase domain-containing protein n=1 Tax=Moorena producens (strain JHB) TaxID=1454205 RepID=A0A9Q9SS79_MOOP1|nr:MULTISPECIES: hypothetical protein [Moorena]NEQ16725.1 hypothetical protein [Moorena sp. SIO3E2]NES87485.1 hypothetical protein [Moorena sp. SIO2B7]NEP35378.1 hypothetical protein [Moorena sp. SIO3B2]NEP66730.1 hypothetical protein [Moorena sp. SIO3A5]NEQ08878.1 hypothetical protein [Moorena sp. SIO4E2]
MLTHRITDFGLIEQLAVAGFRFFLHGHIHRAETSLFRYDKSRYGSKLDQICAGTFGAPLSHLTSHTPCSQIRCSLFPVPLPY